MYYMTQVLKAEIVCELSTRFVFFIETSEVPWVVTVVFLTAGFHGKVWRLTKDNQINKTMMPLVDYDLDALKSQSIVSLWLSSPAHMNYVYMYYYTQNVNVPR